MNVLSFPFPSCFAVFRGPPLTNSVSFEWIDSVMLFDSTECEDDTNGTYIAATLRPWPVGAFVLDENLITSDNTTYDVKIHVPSQSRWVDNHRYMRMPYSIVKHIGSSGLLEFNIPVLAFQSTDWMYALSPEISQTLHCGEASLLHMRQMVFLATECMRQHPTIIRFLESHTNLYDLIHYTRPDEIDRTRDQHIAFWYDRLFCMPMCALQRELLATAPPLSEISSASSSDEEENVLSEPVQEQNVGPVFVYQNHVRMEMSKGTECPITLTPLADMTEFAVSPKCGHIFEPTALTRWLDAALEKGEQMVCPLCRTEVPNGAMFIRLGTD